MSVTGLGRVLITRWYVTLVGLLVTVALFFGAVTVVHVKYEAKSYVLLMPPNIGDSTAPGSTAQVSGNGNPFLELGGLQPAVDALSRAAMDASNAQALQKKGMTATYNV